MTVLFHMHKTRLHLSPMDVWLEFMGYCSQAVEWSAFPRCKPQIRSTANSTVTFCNSFSISQQTSCHLLNLEAHYHAHKIQVVVTILSQMNAVRNLPSDIFQIHFNVILPPNPGLLNGLFPLGFQTTTLHSFSHTVHAECLYPSHSPWFDLFEVPMRPKLKSGSRVWNWHKLIVKFKLWLIYCHFICISVLLWGKTIDLN